MLKSVPMAHEVQVQEGYHNTSHYDTLERFISYHYQISSALELHPRSVLEIGIGNRVVSTYLKNRGLEVTTCDFDPSLNPDIVSDIRKIDAPDASFDLTMACQILEHIPFEEFEQGMSELHRISKKHVIISLPYRHTGFEFVFKMPFVRSLFKKTFLDFFIRKGVKFPGFAVSTQHHWEIDGHDFKLRDVRAKLEKKFRILKEFSPVLNKYHWFFILEKK